MFAHRCPFRLAEKAMMHHCLPLSDACGMIAFNANKVAPQRGSREVQ
jgi:hypothetical protein